MIKSSYIFRIGIIAAISILFMQIYSCNTAVSSDANDKHEHEEESIELAELMFHNQRYMDKLYFAGRNQNWKLAEFYLHELDENMEKLIEEKLMENDVNVSDLAKTMFPPVSEELKKSIQSGDTSAFLKAYDLTVRTCNNCHAASKYEFIQITIPTQPTFTNQRY